MLHSPRRLLLADDHAFFREGVKLMLKENADIQIVGEADSYQATLSLLEELTVDYLILDYQMPGGKGLAGIREIRQTFPELRIILVTGISSGVVLDAVLETGIHGIVLKEGSGDELFEALNAVETGKSYVSDAARNYLRISANARLTKREQQIMSMVADGMSNIEIAAALSLSPKTVDNHRTNLMKKLDLHNTAEVVAFALQVYKT